jgi:DNA-binding CsgD family transcriptional regulator
MSSRGARSPAAVGVLGRDAELGRIEAWLRRGESDGPASGTAGAVLVIEGEPGIGKTTLWAEARRRARRAGWDVLSCRPAPSDAGLPHLGLADLLRSVPEADFVGLPPPQRRPLAVALLREEAGGADLEPRSVGTGLTALLEVLAERRPQMLAVDDAQWLDSASARSLAFALRRLDDRPLRLLATVRLEPAQERAAARTQPGPRGRAGAFGVVESALDRHAIQRLPVGPLSVATTHQVLRDVLGVSFPRPVLVRIHRAAGGNPFYALEIAREVHRLGVPRAGEPLPIPDDDRDLALVRLRRLPPQTRDALAVVATMSRPTAEHLDLEALAAAEQAGIVRVRLGGRIEFTHPLFGSALYSSLPEATRRGLHRDLAGRVASLEEQARHLALATTAPSEATAKILDRAADVAAARGAADVAVELKDLACQITPEHDQEAAVRRRLELADRRYFAGDPNGARRELEHSFGLLLPGEQRAQVLLELGSVLWTQGSGDEGMALLSQALGEAETDALRARVHSRISALADDCDLSVEHGEAALALLDPRTDPLLYSFALHNVALFRLYAGDGADHDAIAEGIRLQREATSWEMSTVPAYWARNLDDFDTARQRFEDLLRAFGERGDEASSSGVLTHLAVIEAMTGRMERARALADEALELAEQTEQETYRCMALWARARVCLGSGALPEAREAAGEVMRQLDAQPDVTLESMVRAVLGEAALAAGDLAEADRQLSRADQIEELLHEREPASTRFQADHAEAVIRLGDLARAEALVQRMEARARALPRPWILAVSARSRGLLNAANGDLDEALTDYQRAVQAHRALDMPVERGRTLLAMGRLCRRRNERQRAQAVLAEAVGVFETAGASSWAAVAAGELRRAQGRRGSPQRLTPTERHIAELAGAGLRNHEIATRLFLSRKTVEANLSRVYTKLGIRSRAELAGHLISEAARVSEAPRAEPQP